MRSAVNHATPFAERTSSQRSRRRTSSPLSSPSGIPILCTPNQQHAGSERSTSLEDPTWFSSLTEGAGSRSTSFRRVNLSDQELYFYAKLTSDQIDFDTLMTVELKKWSMKAKRKGFTLFSMHSGGERKQSQVLTTGNIRCSIEEVISVLKSTTDPDLNASMKALYKNEFIYGSVVHVINPDVLISEGIASRLGASDCVAVKTGSFVRSNMFARNEEWCFVESYDRCPSGNSFRMNQSTIASSEIRVGRASRSRVDQLRDITTAFLVEKIPQSRYVKIFFHGKCASKANDKKGDDGVVSLKATNARLRMLAKGVSRIPEIVRRRRLGYQKLANRSAFAVKNSRCTCCTKNLYFLTKKKRCYMCAYYVCDKCWSQEKIETHNRKVTSILVCTRCLECVDSCEYSEVSSQTRCPVRVEPDECKNSRNTEPPGRALMSLLEDALSGSDEATRAAAMFVTEHILNQSEQNRKERGESATMHDPADGNAIRNSEEDPIEVLERCFELEPQPSLEECTLANAEWRNYPIHMPESPSTTVPDFPIPENEAQRLHAITEGNFLNLGEVAELNLICSLASQELNCTIGQITIIDQESELILACNVKDLHRIRMARNQTFCSHLLMDDKPLLLLHPEADVRFCHLDAVAKSGIRFYCGFPITAKDGTVVGSLCCLDFEPRKLTRSQYSMMKKLADAASNVIQNKTPVAILPP